MASAAPEKIEYGIKRYQDETRRLYQIYEDHLNGTKDGERKEWLVGGKYTIADMCTQPWVRMAMWAGVELEKFPALAAWVERIEKRPATQAALKVPEQDMLSKIKNDPVRFLPVLCATLRLSASHGRAVDGPRRRRSHE